MDWWWSWLLTGVGVTGLYFAGRKRALGWGIGIAAQVLWFLYAVVTQQWGFIVSCLAYGSVYTKNFLAWRSEAKAPPTLGVPTSFPEPSPVPAPGSEQWVIDRVASTIERMAKQNIDPDPLTRAGQIGVFPGWTCQDIARRLAVEGLLWGGSDGRS